ncbi:hypothetical protein OAO01_00360 [Oligoflexia bacterium]|nr:hypothetical protein [Oligoflexia bacterium]
MAHLTHIKNSVSRFQLLSVFGFFIACTAFVLFFALLLPEAHASEITQCKLGIGSDLASAINVDSGFEFLDQLLETIIKLAMKLVKMVVQVFCAIINELGVNCKP